MPRYPALYQINTRVRLTELSRALGRAGHARRLQRRRARPPGRAWASTGSGCSASGRPGRRRSASRAASPTGGASSSTRLPDLRDEDIAGSGFAIRAYSVHAALGGDAALARLRERLRAARAEADARLRAQPHGAGPSVGRRSTRSSSSPGSAAELAHAPQNWCRLRTAGGLADPGPRPRPVLRRLARHAAAQLRQGAAAAGDDRRAAAHRRPVRRPALRHGHAAAARGLRAHLGAAQRALLAEGHRRGAPSAARLQLHGRGLLGPGMDAAAAGLRPLPTTSACTTGCATLQARPVREHLQAGLDYQDRLARFLENHDEPRAAATFAPQVHAAAALLTYATPGLRFFHQGQLEGRRVRISPHLVRAPDEPVDADAGASSTPGCWRRCATRRCATASGRCSTAPRPGPATPASASSSPGTGRAPARPGCARR